jgi:hypothetical protein
LQGDIAKRSRKSIPHVDLIALFLLVSVMTVHASRLLTPEEFAALIEIAVNSPDALTAPAHLAKLVALGYVVMTAKGPMVTGDGLIRITESE